MPGWRSCQKWRASKKLTFDRELAANGGIGVKGAWRIGFRRGAGDDVVLKVATSESKLQQLTIMYGCRITWNASFIARLETDFEEKGMARYREYVRETASRSWNLTAFVAVFTGS